MPQINRASAYLFRCVVEVTNVAFAVVLDMRRQVGGKNTAGTDTRNVWGGDDESVDPSGRVRNIE